MTHNIHVHTLILPYILIPFTLCTPIINNGNTGKIYMKTPVRIEIETMYFYSSYKHSPVVFKTYTIFLFIKPSMCITKLACIIKANDVSTDFRSPCFRGISVHLPKIVFFHKHIKGTMVRDKALHVTILRHVLFLLDEYIFSLTATRFNKTTWLCKWSLCTYIYIYTAQWNTNDEMKYNRIKALTVPRISLLQLYANLWNEMCIPLELC